MRRSPAELVVALALVCTASGGAGTAQAATNLVLTDFVVDDPGYPNGLAPYIRVAAVLVADTPCQDVYEIIDDQGVEAVLVDLWLTDGTPTNMLRLSQRFPVDELACWSTAQRLSPSGALEIDLDFARPDVAAWAAAARQANRPTWKVALEIDAGVSVVGEVIETDIPGAELQYEVEDNVAEEERTIGRLPYTLSGRVWLGPTPATLRTDTPLVLNTRPFDCDPLEILEATVDVDLGGGFGSVAVELGDEATVSRYTCAHYLVTPQGADLVADASWQSDPLVAQGQVGGLLADARLVVGAQGLLPPPGKASIELELRLPTGHGAHAVRPGTPPSPDPLGRSRLVLQAPAGAAGSLDGLTFETAAPLYISIEALPFDLGFAGFELVGDEVVGTLAQGGATTMPAAPLRYRQAGGLHSWDPRAPANQGVRSNDVLFSGATITAQTLVLTPDGFSFDVDLHARRGRTAFPALELGWPDGTVHVDESALAGMEVSGRAHTFEMTTRTACPGCGVAGDDGYLVKGAGKVAMSPGDGALVGQVAVGQTTVVAWGPRRDPAADHHVFERPGDAGKVAVLTVPGTIVPLPGIADARVSDYLQGTWSASLDAGVPVVNNRQLVTSTTTLHGNGFFAGVGFGPETYAAPGGQPVVGTLAQSLAGTPMVMALGGARATPLSYTSSIATKLVLRPAGVSGVFNFEFPGVPPPLSVYGFDVALSRFAFRQWHNDVDATSWIDGTVGVQGRAGVAAPFVSMALACTGQLGDGMVDRANATPQDLDAWRARYDITTIGFAPGANDGVCSAADRELHTIGMVDIVALRDDLGLDATWTKEGEPGSKTSISGDPEAVLDPDTSGAGFRFAIAPAGIALGPPAGGAPSLGWFELIGNVRTPFWDPLRALVRAENEASGVTPAGAAKKARTLVVPYDLTETAKVEAGWYTTGNAALAPALDARADTGFEAKRDWAVPLSAHVRWTPATTAGKASRFSPDAKNQGEDKDSLAGILEVQRAIEYITPERTRMTFGMSADLTKVAQLQVPLTVDLRDRETTQAIDTFLQTDAVTKLVDVLEQPTDGIADELGSMFDQTIKAALRTALDTLTGEGAPLRRLADGLAVVQSLGPQLANGLFDGVRAQLDTLRNELGEAVDALVRKVAVELPARVGNLALTLGQSPAPATLAAAREAVTARVAELRQVLAAVRRLPALVGEIDTIVDGLTKQGGAIDQLASAIPSKLADARAALTTLEQQLDPQSGALSFLTCAGNPIVAEVDRAVSTMEALARGLGGDDSSPVTTLLTLAETLGVDLGPVDDAVAFVARQAKGVLTTLTGPVRGIVSQLCAQGERLAGLGQEVKTRFVTPLSTKLQQAESGLVNQATIKQLTQPLLAMKQVFANTLGRVDTLAKACESVATQLDTLTHSAGPMAPPDGAASWPAWVTQALDKAVAGGAQGVQGWLDAQGRPFTATLVDGVTAPLYAYAGTVTGAIADLFTGALGDVGLPTASELRDQITNAIMHSGFIELVDNLVHESLALVGKQLGELTGRLLDQANRLIQALVDKVGGLLDDLLASADLTSEITGALGFSSARLDGYAVFQRESVERLHVDATFSADGDAPSDGDAAPAGDQNEGQKEAAESNDSSFAAALDITSWATNGKGAACLDTHTRDGEAEGDRLIDALISARNLPFELGPSDIKLREIWLGFTLEKAVDPPFEVLGVSGGFELDGVIDFKAFQIVDLAAAFGFGKYENYFGARAGAQFQSIGMEVAFLGGRTCNKEVLDKLDPQAASFVALPAGVPFQGAYVRGGATFPVVSFGCLFELGVTAEVGTWFLLDRYQGKLLGIYVGGAVYGTGVCLASLKGGLRVATNLVLEDHPELRPPGVPGFSTSVVGEGWGALGLGFCEPDEWWTVEDSRDDSWCMTFDASFKAGYDNGSFDVKDTDFGGPH